MSVIITPFRPRPTSCSAISMSSFWAPIAGSTVSGSPTAAACPTTPPISPTGFPNYQSWQSELTVNGNGFDNRLKWTTGLFFFQESSPDDGGFEYLFLPSAGSAPPPVAGKQFTVTDWATMASATPAMPPMPRRPTASPSDTRLTAGVRYTWTSAAPISTPPPSARPPPRRPAMPSTNGVFNPAGFTYQGITYAGPDRCLRRHQSQRRVPAALRNARRRSTRAISSRPGPWRSITICSTRPWSMSPAARAIARAASTPRRPIPPCMVGLPENVLDFEAGVKSDWTLWGMPLRTNLGATTPNTAISRSRSPCPM